METDRNGLFADAASIEPWLTKTFDCICGKKHHIALQQAVIGEDAFAQLSEYCVRTGLGRVTLVADSRTYKAAGAAVKQHLENKGVTAKAVVLHDNDVGEVTADAEAVFQVMLEMPADTEALIAVGSGTIHDIVRFVSHKTGRAFVSVPTAPSVDGFASVGAPMLIRGFKQTVNACSPDAVFADLTVLKAAPQPMIAAGFGDMLGKFTSLADWELGRILLQEHHCPLAAEITRRGLQLCIDHLDEIRRGTTQGMKALMEGLILSGISMLMVGHSRPASGAEHHLSHYWEMKFIKERRKALLHGAKVGTAAVIMAEYYDRIRRLETEEAQSLVLRNQPPSEQEDREQIAKAYGIMAPQVIAENADCWLPEQAMQQLKSNVIQHWQSIQETARSVPDSGQMAEWLSAAGGPITTGQLGVSDVLVVESLHNALYVRNRFTILRLNRLIFEK